MSTEDDERTVLNISMTLAQWRVVIAYLEGGTYRDVCEILTAIWLQTQQQFQAVKAAQALQAYEQQAAHSAPSTPDCAPAASNRKVN